MLLIKNGTIQRASGALKADMLVEEGRVKAIGQGLSAGNAEVLDAQGLLIMPGLVDIHGHLREPGQEYKETIASGTLAAVRGGYTSICCMANTTPVNDCGAITAAIIAKARREAHCRVYPIGSVTKGIKGEELSEMADMKTEGAVAVSDDGRPMQDMGLLRSALSYANYFGLPIVSHSEDLGLSAEGYMHEGAVSARLGIMGIPACAEESAIAREVAVAASLKLPLHIAHISARGSVAVIREAKARGAKITCETAPHYLMGTDEMCEDYDTAAKVSPPLRTHDDQLALIEGLKDGTIDCIATDHAPHHLDDKRVEFALAANGISGYETALSLCWTALVAPGHLSPAQLISKMTVEPAQIFNLPGGTLEEGGIADFTVFDPNRIFTVRANEFISKGRNTPFDGFELTGQVLRTYVEGRLVWEEML